MGEEGTESPDGWVLSGLDTGSLSRPREPLPPACPEAAAHAGLRAASGAAPGPPGVFGEDSPHDPAPGSAASVPVSTATRLSASA